MSALLDAGGAVISDCGQYRYRLWRTWDEGKPALCFIMLNPSTADAQKNDPTVERCQRRARRLGFGGLQVLNIFALRSTNPSALYTHANPWGPENDAHIFAVCKTAGMVVAAWGVHGLLYRRAESLRVALAYNEIKLHHLGLTKEGAPRHPLYVGYGVQPEVWG